MSETQIEDVLAEHGANLQALDAVVKFDLGDDDVIVLDAKATPPTVTAEDREADCTIKISRKNLGKLLGGNLNPMMAFTMGKLKVSGDMGVAMRLSALVGED